MRTVQALMSNVAKLKKQAAEFEQKKQLDKALAVYVKLLDAFDQYADELDVGLFNRVGDLMLRQGNVADAVDYYEKAVDHYADTGFFNNAIALCNKILRHSPGRASVYYKLGKISAQKGFKGDAKVNFLEYADRMQKAGKTDEAFRALKEFADLCPDQDEIRLMLADQLTKAGRKHEAVEQLQLLYARYDAEGRADDAANVANRIHELDPSVELKSDGTRQRKSSSSELIFLDLDEPSPRSTTPVRGVVEPPRGATPPASLTPASITPASVTPTSLTPASMTPASVTPTSVTPPRATPVSATPVRSTPPRATPVRGLTPVEPEPIIEAFTRADVAITSPEAGALDAPLSGITRIGDDVVGFEKTPSESLLGLESTRLADDDIIRSTPTSSLLDLEPTSLGSVTPVGRSSVPTHAMSEHVEPSTGDLEMVIPPSEAPRAPGGGARTSIEFDESSLLTPIADMPPAPPRTPPDRSRSALDDLPLMDLDVPTVKTPAPATPRTTTSLEEITLSDDLELIEPGAEPEPADAETGSGLELLDLNEEPLTADDELAIIPTPSVARRSTMVAIQSMEILRASVEGEPENWTLRRQLAEAMLEAGDRDGGIRELEAAMAGAEHAGDLDLASSLAEEVARLEPESVKHHQKRVEYAFRANDRPRLIEAYLSLGDALLRDDQPDKARTVYQRVIDLAPDEVRASAALDALVVPEPEPEPLPPRTSGARRTTAVPQAPAPAAAPLADFVNLGDWLRDEESPKDTRMVVAEQQPTGDEEADFADMLRKFKQGVAENVDAEDYQSHYDLAIAFKEMGLLDEAIAEFQKALGSPTNRLPTYEALGQCFLEKNQPKLAMSILSRGLNEPAHEDLLVGVLYWLGRAAEELGLAADALGYYQRVFVLDIQFRDIAERMTEVERAVAR